MNVFIHLFVGLLIGYALKKEGRKPNLDRPTGIALLAMIFFLGVKIGNIHVNGLWLLGVSAVFAVLTMVGSLLLAEVIG
jgi:hypothetical protein